MAICSRCGNYSPDGTVMCPVCGMPFPPVTQPVQQQPIQGQPFQQQPVQQQPIQQQPVSPPSIPSIPSVPSVGSMASQVVRQTVQQAATQMMGGSDLMAPEAQGEIVLSSWKMPTSVPSAMQMGASAVQKATKGKYAWMWFLIPVFTILAWVISQLAK